MFSSPKKKRSPILVQEVNSTPKFDRPNIANMRALKLRGLLRELREVSESREKKYHSIKV